MRAITVLPRNDAGNGWSRILPPRAPRAPLTGTKRADWVVVGAGYAGLAAARRLAENAPNDRIIVLFEALEAGENASGRNSGFGIDLPHVVGSAQDDLSVAHAHLRLSRTALKYLEEIVEGHAIACDWSRAGKYHAAVSPRGEAEMLAPFIEMLKTLDEPHRILDRSENGEGARHVLLSCIGLHAGRCAGQSGGTDARTCRYLARKCDRA